VEYRRHGERVRLTAVKHNVRTPNSRGQDPREFPFALVNMKAWRELPFDLRAARWYRTKPEALGAAETSQSAAPDIDCWKAEFADGVRLELRRQGRARWFMWTLDSARWVRRKDFASPHLDHAKRTAEDWYGEAVRDWEPSSQTGRTARRRRDDSGSQANLEGVSGPPWPPTAA
jgi:hypothetical protein